MDCRAVVAVEKGKVKLGKWEVFPPKEGEIQMKNVCTLISPGTERAFILGLDNAKNEYPFVPGYCCAGYVNEIGEGVTGYKKGDRVCAFALDIGHREIGNVPVHKVVKIPEGVSFDHAAFVPLGQVATQAVRKCSIELGEAAAVLGLGIIGLLAMQLAKAAGALPVIGLDRNQVRLELAGRLGADMVFDNSAENFKEELLQMTEGRGIPVVLEGTGYPSAIEEACQLCARMGRVSLLGSTRGLSEINFYRDVHKKGLTLIGSHAECIPLRESYPRHWSYRDDATCFLKLIQSGRINVEKMIDLRVRIEEVVQVYDRLLHWDKNLLGVIIEWDKQ